MEDKFDLYIPQVNDALTQLNALDGSCVNRIKAEELLNAINAACTQPGAVHPSSQALKDFYLRFPQIVELAGGEMAMFPFLKEKA